MKRNLYVLTVLILCASRLPAQQLVHVDSLPANYNIMNSFYAVNGQPFVNAKFARVVSGSPYFIDQWGRSTVGLAPNLNYGGIIARLNLFDDQIHFLRGNNEYIVDKPVYQFDLTDTTTGQKYFFRTGYPATSTSNQRTFFQVLADGNAALLMQRRKTLSEIRGYGSATVDHIIRTSDNYFVYTNGEMKRLKKMRADLLEALAPKQKEVAEFIDQNKLQLKSQDELLKVIVYYNTLK